MHSEPNMSDEQDPPTADLSLTTTPELIAELFKRCDFALFAFTDFNQEFGFTFKGSPLNVIGTCRVLEARLLSSRPLQEKSEPGENAPPPDGE